MKERPRYKCNKEFETEFKKSYAKYIGEALQEIVNKISVQILTNNKKSK
jgi:hypothetical protein